MIPKSVDEQRRSGEMAYKSVSMHGLDRLAYYMDSAFPIGPYRVGLDPILGLVPGLGDVLTSFALLVFLSRGAQQGAPTSLMLRMIGNVMLEVIVGAIPVVGDLFDFAWKAHERNYRLLANFQQNPRRTTWTTRIIILTALALLLFMCFASVWLFVTLIEAII